MTTTTREQLQALIDSEINIAVSCLDRLAGLPENVTSNNHRLFVEKILNAALLQATVIQLEALK